MAAMGTMRKARRRALKGLKWGRVLTTSQSWYVNYFFSDSLLIYIIFRRYFWCSLQSILKSRVGTSKALTDL